MVRALRARASWLIAIVVAAFAGNCGQARRTEHGGGRPLAKPEALPPEWRAQHDSDYLRTHRDSIPTVSLDRVMEAESIKAAGGGPQPDRSVGEYGD